MTSNTIHKNSNNTEIKKSFLYIWIAVLFISIFHYASPHSLHWTHDILRRLYYLPIIFAGFYTGRKHTLLVATFIAILYIPHAFTEIFNMDPESSINKSLEIILYFIIAFITSTLSDRLKQEKNKYQNTSNQLQQKLIEVKRLEEQLIQSGKLEALGQMSAGFAHEIKNPLSSIQATNEFIEEAITDEAIKEFIEIQKKELHRLKELLEQFLNFAKPSELKVEELSLPHLLQDLMTLIQTQKKSGIQVKNELQSQGHISGDYKKLYQVFLNLILNAIDAIDENGQVLLSLKETQETVILSIKDTGCGISEKHLKQIFNPFFTTKEKGTGLGLSIAFKILEQHQALLDVYSKENEGTEFMITFKKI